MPRRDAGAEHPTEWRDESRPYQDRQDKRAGRDAHGSTDTGVVGFNVGDDGLKLLVGEMVRGFHEP